MSREKSFSIPRPTILQYHDDVARSAIQSQSDFCKMLPSHILNANSKGLLYATMKSPTCNPNTSADQSLLPWTENDLVPQSQMPCQ